MTQGARLPPNLKSKSKFKKKTLADITNNTNGHRTKTLNLAIIPRILSCHLASRQVENK